MPKKLERCVRKVTKKGGVKSPWAVCKASLKKKRKKHHSAPLGSFIEKRSKL